MRPPSKSRRLTKGWNEALQARCAALADDTGEVGHPTARGEPVEQRPIGPIPARQDHPRPGVPTSGDCRGGTISTLAGRPAAAGVDGLP